MRQHLIDLLVSLSCLALVACGSEAGSGRPALRFTAIPDSEKTELDLRFQPLAEYLERELGIPVEYVPTPDYSASVEMFKNGDVQLAWFGGLTGVQARAAVPGAHAIAQGAVDPRFRSYFIAHDLPPAEPDAPFPVELLRGRRFTFGSRQSTSGRLMPEFFLRRETGVAPEDFFAEIGFSGSHDKTAELVNTGAFEVGVLNYLTYERLLDEGQVDAATCRVVWVTPEYADYNWTVHPDLDEAFGPGTTESLRSTLLSLEDADLLAALQRPEGLIAAEDAAFQGIADVARTLGFLRDGTSPAAR